MYRLLCNFSCSFLSPAETAAGSVDAAAQAATGGPGEGPAVGQADRARAHLSLSAPAETHSITAESRKNIIIYSGIIKLLLLYGIQYNYDVLRIIIIVITTHK